MTDDKTRKSTSNNEPNDTLARPKAAGGEAKAAVHGPIAGQVPGQRRYKSVCFTCRTPFEPRPGGGHLICPSCILDSLRGDRRFRPRF